MFVSNSFKQVNHHRQQNNLRRHHEFYTRIEDPSIELSSNHVHKQTFDLQLKSYCDSYTLQLVLPTKLYYSLLSLDHVTNSLDIAEKSGLRVCIWHEWLKPILMLLPLYSASSARHDLGDPS